MSCTIVYHGGCFDGVAGAWVAHSSRKKRCERYCADEEIKLIGLSYDERPNFKPLGVEDLLIIVDFSFPYEQLLKLSENFKKIILIDHHKTAEEDLIGKTFHANVEIHFDMKRSGAGLAWDVFFPKLTRPWFIDNVEDRDLWRFVYPTTKSIIAYLASQPLNIELFNRIEKMGLNAVFDRGLGILDYINTFGEKVCETWTINWIGGYVVPTINTPYMNCSDHLEKLMEKLPGHPFYAYYFCKAENVWQFGLRSRGDFDVSEVAKLFGGGGHKNAAGFTVAKLPWSKS